MLQPPPVDPWFRLCVGTLASASLVTWFVLGRRRPILAYAPRRPVPWNFIAAAVVVLMVISRLASLAMGNEALGPDEWTSPLEMTENIALGIVTQVTFIGALFIAVVVLSGATQRDVGLPEFADELGRDLKLSTVAWLAALLPVYGLQGLLVSLAGETSSHPLLRMIQQESNAWVMIAAFVAAVVVAPICEEIAFRLFLQGWLEKVEDQRLGWRAAVVPMARDAEPPAETGEALVSAAPPASEPPSRGLAGLPYGWAPILASSTVFAAAHAGHGPDPFALFLLAIILGYLYQRTHHIVPSIVTHMLFNFTTLVAMYWAWMYRE